MSYPHSSKGGISHHIPPTTARRPDNRLLDAALGAFLMVVLPAGSVQAGAADEKRIDPEIVEVETAGALGVQDVSYSMIQNLCGDGDACTLRMVLSGSGGSFDSRTFIIGDNGVWSANIPGGGAFTSGNAGTVGDEIVFQMGTDSMCWFQDATSFSNLLIRKFELVVDGGTLLPGPATCVLRIED